MDRVDYLVIRSGGAGLYPALLASAVGSVAILTKGRVEQSNTWLAQGGIAAPLGQGDSPERHAADTLQAGAGLGDPGAVRVLTEDAVPAIEHLVRLGMPFDTLGGELSLGLEGAHQVPRIVHAGGDATGANLERTLIDRVREAGVLTREHCRVTRLEFFQFHPTALHLPGAPSFLISEAVRGDGGYLINGRGERFMIAVDNRAELAPRDIVARAIAREMGAGSTQSVWLDIRHLPADRVKVRFPTIYQACLGYGLDITKEPIPVAPAAHYYMGGIRTNYWGETSIPSLFACGECACTGIHGANRLASNSLLELLVFARRIVCRTMTRVIPPEPASSSESVVRITIPVPKPDLAGVGGSPPSVDELQALMWRYAGISRTGPGLSSAATRLDAWLAALTGQAVAQPELYSLALVSRLLVEAAGCREESRGGHYREDFPQPSPVWKKRIVVEKERGS